MTDSKSIDELPNHKVESIVSQDSLSIGEINDLISTSSDPVKLKILLAALERASAKQTARAKRIEDAAQDLQEIADEARACAEGAEASIEKTKVLIQQAEQRIGDAIRNRAGLKDGTAR